MHGRSSCTTASCLRRATRREVFNGYDGTVFVRGYGKLAWHGTPYRESKLQHLPNVLRKCPHTHGRLLRFFSRQYRSFEKRGWL